MTLREAVGSIQSPKQSSNRRDRRSRSTSRSPRYGRRRYQESYSRPRQPSPPRQKESYTRSRRTSPPRTRPDCHERQYQQQPRQEKEFTKLNSDKSTILAVLKTEPEYRPPRPMKPGRPPSSRYCEYHEDSGHTTEQCFILIEGKIKRGQLVHFVEQDYRSNHDSDRVIDVIFGGDSAGGLFNNSKKLYAREVFNINPEVNKRPRPNPSPVISFSDDDYPSGMFETHQDALVITAKIGTNTIKKILIDNGSSVDILYHHAFSRMDIGDRKLENVNTFLLS